MRKIAAVADRADQLRTGACGVKLLADARDQHVDGAVRGSAARPRVQSRIWSRVRTRRGLCAKHASKSNSGARERQSDAGGVRQLPGIKIDDEAVEGQATRWQRRRLGIRSPEQGPDTGEQFPWAERFHQIIIGTHFQPDDAIDFITLCGEHQDRQNVRCPQAATDR